MRVFLFQEDGGERIALTRDSGGSRLPQLGLVWHARGAVDLREYRPEFLKAEPGEILEALMRDGYFAWPPLELH